MKILVVEDKPEERDAALRQLSDHEVTTVGYFSGAAKALDKEIFDVVLTDLIMPSGYNDGDVLHPYGLTVALKALSKGIQKIAIVSYGGGHDHEMMVPLRLHFNPTLLNNSNVRLLMFLNEGRRTNGCIVWEGDNEKGWQYISKDWAEALKRLVE
ncbi:MAG: response regulator [bacterium]|nr:response regulator [bacterium]